MAEVIFGQGQVGMDTRQTWESWLLDPLSCHQFREAETWVCRAFGDKGSLSWIMPGTDLAEDLRWMHEDSTQGYWLSQAGFFGPTKDESHIAYLQSCFLTLNRRFAGGLFEKPSQDAVKIILLWCKRHGIPAPSLVVFTGDDFYIKWLFTRPIIASQLARWNAIQKFLYRKFQTLGADPEYIKATSMMYVPGFLNTEKGQEVRIVYHSEEKITFDDFARRLPLAKDEGKEYQNARKQERKVEQKRHLGLPSQKRPDGLHDEAMSTEEVLKDWQIILSLCHPSEDRQGAICLKRIHAGKQRKVEEEWAAFDLSGVLASRLSDLDRDHWVSVGEFAIRRKTEKWATSVRCNFLYLMWNRSELDHNPAHEEAITLIHARCDERGIPRPTAILNMGDGVFLIWAYDKNIPKLGPADSFYFNYAWEEVERFLFGQFWDLGADPRQLHAAAMLRLPGSLNTTVKEGDRRVRIIDFSGSLCSFDGMLDRAGGRAYSQEAARGTQELESSELDRELRDAFDMALHKEARIDWSHDLLAFHQKGYRWVCLGYFEPIGEDGGKRSWKQKWVMARDLQEELLRLDLNQDVYVTQMEFNTRKRDVKHVASLQVSFLDIDWKLLEDSSLKPEEWKDIVLEHCRKHNIPEPNDIVFTGNGLHVKWIYQKPVSRDRLELWNLIERLLYTQFKDLGADPASTDAARVLRIPGSLNCKPGTTDRRVRVLHHSSITYTFDEFTGRVRASIPVDQEEFNACVEEWEKGQKASTALPVPAHQTIVPFVKNSDDDVRQAEKNWILNELNFHHPRNTYMYLEDGAGEHSLWVPTRQLHEQIKNLDLKRGWRMSPAEFLSQMRGDDEMHIANIPFNFVNITRCPEGYALNSQECVKLFLEHCRTVNGVGIPEPNTFIYTGHSLLVLWGYTHPLPGYALSRWTPTQEFITHHFRDWGTETEPANLKATAMLPLSGFADGESEAAHVIYHRSADYSFDTLATNVLPWTQQEVREYEAEKAAERAQETSRPKKQTKRQRKAAKKKARKFAKRALARYNDIVRLIMTRKAPSGSVPQGCRELCVFYAMNCGIQAGFITLSNFDMEARKLIAFCGPNFADCDPKILLSLKKRLLRGEDTYHPKTKTLIKKLKITLEEQRQMKVINTFRHRKRRGMPRSQWMTIHHQEADRPWLKQGISRSTYFKRRKQRREARAKAIAEKRRRAQMMKIQVSKYLSLRQNNKGILHHRDLPRTGSPLYYEGARREGGPPLLLE